jgi:hypothetical protein
MLARLADLAWHTLLLLLLPAGMLQASCPWSVSTIDGADHLQHQSTYQYDSVNCPLARVDLDNQAAAIALQASTRLGQRRYSLGINTIFVHSIARGRGADHL